MWRLFLRVFLFFSHQIYCSYRQIGRASLFLVFSRSCIFHKYLYGNSSIIISTASTSRDQAAPNPYIRKSSSRSRKKNQDTPLYFSDVCSSFSYFQFIFLRRTDRVFSSVCLSPLFILTLICCALVFCCCCCCDSHLFACVISQMKSMRCSPARHPGEIISMTHSNLEALGDCGGGGNTLLLLLLLSSCNERHAVTLPPCLNPSLSNSRLSDLLLLSYDHMRTKSPRRRQPWLLSSDVSCRS